VNNLFKNTTQQTNVNYSYILIRSGTYAAIVLGKFKSVKNISTLVDIIVGMREHRDGLVELPSQLRYVSRLLNIGDPAVCDWKCQGENIFVLEKLIFASALEKLANKKVLSWAPYSLFYSYNAELLPNFMDQSGASIVIASFLSNFLCMLMLVMLTLRIFLFPVDIVSYKFLVCYAAIGVILFFLIALALSSEQS
jgi:hypothetical protein